MQLTAPVTPVTCDERGDSNVTHRTKIKRPVTAIEEGAPTDVAVADNCPDSKNAMVTELKLYMSELICVQTNSMSDAISNLTDIIKAQNSRIELLKARVLELEGSSSIKQPGR